MEIKLCVKCAEEKSTELFSLTKKGNISKYCKECTNSLKKQNSIRWVTNNKDKVNELQRIRRRSLVKLNPQLNKCIIRDCIDDSIEYKGLTKYCKSHAMDVLIFNSDV